MPANIKPIGINRKDNDRDVLDGSLMESINVQIRDGSLKLIPERIATNINVNGYKGTILHKVGDENTINVLAFTYNETPGAKYLNWIGTITDGVYLAKTSPVQIDIAYTSKMSYTILNGLIYFMGDGSSTSEQYYYKLEFQEPASTYKVYDMYKWKSLVPFYGIDEANSHVELVDVLDIKTNNILIRCGIVLIRFALVLKTGETVLHSPIYGQAIYSVNRQDEQLKKDDVLKHIHSIVDLNLSFSDMTLFGEEISAINVYASLPYYINKSDTTFTQGTQSLYYELVKDYDINSQFMKKSEENFYLIKTIQSPSDTEKIFLYTGELDSDIVAQNYDGATVNKYTKIDLTTIGGGGVMPVDNFTYHKLYGKIDSYNGRLVIKRPTTVMSGGHIRALSLEDGDSEQGFKMSSEDGDLNGYPYAIDKHLVYNINPLDPAGIGLQSRGMLSYPDYRANKVGASIILLGGSIFGLIKSRKNTSHNMSCCFDFNAKTNGQSAVTITGSPASMTIKMYYKLIVNYGIPYESINTSGMTPAEGLIKYQSDNRAQFSEIGEFTVWPAINSYRIGEGKVMALGSGRVDPSNSVVISPLLIGTTDGSYVVNLDPRGDNFISSITRTGNYPFISEETLDIDGAIAFVSDKGLILFSNGEFSNITEDYFPQYGSGNFPDQESVFNGYSQLTEPFFGDANPYLFVDMVKYLKQSILAYDARRANIWCSNPSCNYSFVFNVPTKQWGMSTLVFSEKQELFSILSIDGEDIYSRFLVKSGGNNLLVLSGEDLTKEVYYHLMTRPIKFNSDNFKKIGRLIARTLLVRDSESGYVSFGAWGHQDIDKNKVSIPLVQILDSSTKAFPNNIRCNIPITARKGSYKAVTILQAGLCLPESYISSFDFDVLETNNKHSIR